MRLIAYLLPPKTTAVVALVVSDTSAKGFTHPAAPFATGATAKPGYIRKSCFGSEYCGGDWSSPTQWTAISNLRRQRVEIRTPEFA